MSNLIDYINQVDIREGVAITSGLITGIAQAVYEKVEINGVEEQINEYSQNLDSEVMIQEFIDFKLKKLTANFLPRASLVGPNLSSGLISEKSSVVSGAGYVGLALLSHEFSHRVTSKLLNKIYE